MENSKDLPKDYREGSWKHRKIEQGKVTEEAVEVCGESAVVVVIRGAS